MSKALVVGDLHTKYHIFEKVKEIGKNYDKVIFLGDYVDEWQAIPEASCNLLMGLKEYYEQNVGKVVLCIGNHEASNVFGKGFRASGYNPIVSNYAYDFFFKFWSIFKIAFVEQGFLLSHAGLTNDWALEHLPNCQTPEDFASALNRTYRAHFGKETPFEEENEKIFYALGSVGYYRGGSGIPSPLWADINELLQDPIPGIKQIVGHSPVNTCIHFNSKGNDLYFCDTHSLFSDLTPIGDSTLLEIIDGEVYKMDLDGNRIPW